MSTTGVAASLLRNAATMSSTPLKDTPCANARSEARWITGPSAIGSENGTPSSTTSAPAATSACSNGTVTAGVGSPAVTYGINATRPAARSVANLLSIRFTIRLMQNPSWPRSGLAGWGARSVLDRTRASRDKADRPQSRCRPGFDAHLTNEGPGCTVARLANMHELFDAARALHPGPYRPKRGS